MRCRRCGHENDEDANFCSSCGAPISSDGTEQETTVSLELLEGRRELDDELGGVVDQIPEGVGMLVVRRGPNAGSTFALEGDETTIGRHPDSDIFLDDVTVSRRHALIRRTVDGYEVSDVGSLNGTYVDREAVETAKLRDMHELQIGRFVLTFVIGGPHEAVS